MLLNVPKQTAPYGSWESTLGAERLAEAGIRFGQLAVVGDSVLWSEGRAAEGGRNVVVECAAHERCIDRFPAPFDSRTRVHEYGGGAFVAAADGELFFSHDADQRLYRCRPGAAPVPITAPGRRRYADAIVDAPRQRLVAVREDHGDDAARRAPPARQEAVNTLVAIDLVAGSGTGAETVLAAGHDFYASPRLSPDGRHLAWLAWNHPQMPWSGSTLWVAALDPAGTPGEPRRVAGGAAESIFQPEWSPSGELHFASDRTGWWNLYAERGGSVQLLMPAMQAEFGEPQWQFGMSMYGFEPSGSIVCVVDEGGRSQLARIDPAGTFTRIATRFCMLRQLRVGKGYVAFIGASETQAESVVRLDPSTGRDEVLRCSNPIALAPDDIAVAEAIDFPSTGGTVAHAFFYAPKNARHAGPVAERPPLLVVSHGGPTSATSAALKPALQFWTQRGFAVVDVNYGGSTGYGRAYRERLDGQWGVVDVDDVVAAARFLVARDDVDGARLAIRGSSAGGYTTLAALAFRSVFQAGASHYGVSDLESLARETHKFESRYLDSLVGPWPERADLYRARSPIHFAGQLSSALILLQGAEDKAVPPAQAETMYRAVRARGLPVAYLLFPGEQHGFRRAESIRRALEAELYFYGRIFGFTPAGRVDPVTIENLPAA